MGLSEEGFNAAVKAARRAAKNPAAFKHLSNALRGGGSAQMEEAVERWRVHGVRDFQDESALYRAEKQRFTDSSGQAIDAEVTVKELDSSSLQRNEWLIIGFAQSGTPEWSRSNAGGLCLRELARQCDVTWKKSNSRGSGYYCNLKPSHFFKPSDKKIFLNRHYADLREQYIKLQLLGAAAPRCTLFVPTCPLEELPRTIFDFMYSNNFHSDKTCFVSADRQYNVGETKFRINCGRDKVYLEGLPLKSNHVKHKEMYEYKGYDKVKKKLGEMRTFRIGVGSHLPDDAMVVFSEKERVFMKEYQFPLLCHAVFLAACGYPVGQMGEAVQRGAEAAKNTMDETEIEHEMVRRQQVTDDHFAAKKKREERNAELEHKERVIAEHQKIAVNSAVSRFRKRRLGVSPI